MKTTHKLTEKLLSKAQESMKQTYAPYSDFKVGAAIIDNNGNIYGGCNVENAAYPLGTCAEAGAIAQMVLNGGRVINHILLVSSGDQHVVPCGGCCQKIKEFCDNNTIVLSYFNNNIKAFEVKDLLPHAFSNEFLK